MSRSAAPTPAAATPKLRFTPDYVRTLTAADGTRVRLRLLRPQDRDVLLAGFARLSPESRYRRFFTAMPRLPEATLERLLHTDGWNHVALGLETAAKPREGVAVARFIRLPDAPDTAEAAIAVVDHMQRRGLGKLLLAALAAAARERGITRFRFEVQRDNEAVAALLRDLDLRPVSVDGSLAVYEVAVGDPTPERPVSSGLADVLRLAARGLQVLVRRFT